jgi:hypothetical protein
MGGVTSANTTPDGGGERALAAGVRLEDDAMSSPATLVVTHMGERIVIPRVAVDSLVASGRFVAPRTHLHVADQG